MKPLLTALFSFILFFNSHFAQNSVLSTGNWYKIGITEDGIYKLSQSDLQSLGLNVNSIDPRNISIHGNGGGMLPENNSAYRPDDLTEIAIQVVGESDGAFDANDYILFYGKGQHTWKYNATSQRFEHTPNIYSDTTFYFVTVSGSPGKRIVQQASSSSAATDTADAFDDFAIHETDSVNLLRSGRVWYGEQFGLNSTSNFSFTFNDLVPGDSVKLNLEVAARTIRSDSSSFDVQANGTLLANIPVIKVGSNFTDTYARIANYHVSFSPTASPIIISFTYNQTDTFAKGWLDFIELTARRQLTFSGAQMTFRDAATVGAGNITEFILQNATSVSIWDITDHSNIKEQQNTINVNAAHFKIATDTLKEFVAFNGSAFLTPALYGSIPNQNLHALPSATMLIVTHPDFLAAANRLADHHRSTDALSVQVVTAAQIFNEFSSGAQDVTAIKDFVRRMYNNASPDSLKYLLLFGDASFDYKDRIAGNTNFVPTFESVNSISPVATYLSDDYFGYLEDAEGATGNVDIGIGRLPVKNLTEANAATDKVIHYSDAATLGKWRKEIVFIADDEDNNTHMLQENNLATFVEGNHCDYNINKIYFDNYTQVYDTFGSRYPEVKQEIISKANAGALVLNYTGRGSAYGWGHERVLDSSDIATWTNADRADLVVAGTADITLMDDPAVVSIGETLVLSSGKGSIACFGGSRLTYSGENYDMHHAFLEAAFEPVNGEMPRLGDVVKKAKLSVAQTTNNIKTILIGDPAVRLAYPKNAIAVTSIDGNPISATPDSFLAAGSYIMSGEIQDVNGTLLSNFNGWVYVSVFDKQIADTTLGNDGQPPFNFLNWRAPFLNDSVLVTNGLFTITLNIPSGVDSLFGYGKISLYASDGSTDASGCYANVLIGDGAETISAVDPLDNDIDLRLYPSPGNGQATVEIQGFAPREAVFFIYDNLGREVKRMEGISSTKFSFSTEDLSKGIYLFTFMDTKNAFKKTGKLIIN